MLHRWTMRVALRCHSTSAVEKTVSNNHNRLRLVEEQYCHDISTPLLPTVLAQLEEETTRDFKNAHMMISKTHAQWMHQLVRLFRPQRVLEIGTFTGYSALAMASALSGSAKLITLELNKCALSVAQRHAALAGLEQRIEFKQGPALDSISALATERPGIQFDMIFLDANKKSYIDYFETIMNKNMLSDRGVLLVDNVLFFGQVHREAGYSDPQSVEASKNIKKTAAATHAFNKHVLGDPRVEVVVLPVFDGLSMIQKSSCDEAHPTGNHESNSDPPRR